MKILIPVGVIVVIALILVNTGLYVVDEKEQVIITRFGQVTSVTQNPGIYIKAPFIDTATTYDRRVLRIDAPPERILEELLPELLHQRLL